MKIIYQKDHIISKIIMNESSIREHSNGLGNLIMNQRSRSSHERESTLTERVEYLYHKQTKANPR